MPSVDVIMKNNTPRILPNDYQAIIAYKPRLYRRIGTPENCYNPSRSATGRAYFRVFFGPLCDFIGHWMGLLLGITRRGNRPTVKNRRKQLKLLYFTRRGNAKIGKIGGIFANETKMIS